MQHQDVRADSIVTVPSFTPGLIVTFSAAMCLCTASFSSEEANHEPTGVNVLLPSVCTPEQERNEGDGRPIWVRLLPKDLTYINQEQISRNIIVPRVAALMATRQERVVYLQGANEISYGETAAIAGDLQASIEDLNIALVTSSQFAHSTRFHCFVFGLVNQADIH